MLLLFFLFSSFFCAPVSTGSVSDSSKSLAKSPKELLNLFEEGQMEESQEGQSKSLDDSFSQHDQIASAEYGLPVHTSTSLFVRGEIRIAPDPVSAVPLYLACRNLLI